MPGDRWGSYFRNELFEEIRIDRCCDGHYPNSSTIIGLTVSHTLVVNAIEFRKLQLLPAQHAVNQTRNSHQKYLTRAFVQ